MRKALAAGSKTTPSTAVPAESDRSVIVEVAKVATSPGPFGTVGGVQLAAVFHSPLVGLGLQVALPANAVCRMSSNSSGINPSRPIGLKKSRLSMSFVLPRVRDRCRANSNHVASLGRKRESRRPNSSCQLDRIFSKLCAYENDNSPIKKFNEPLACTRVPFHSVRTRLLCAFVGGSSTTTVTAPRWRLS